MAGLGSTGSIIWPPEEERSHTPATPHLRGQAYTRNAPSLPAPPPKLVQSPAGFLTLRRKAFEYQLGLLFAPILGLVDQGCDLEADILPTVARTVPELPRPLRNWGAQWLVPGCHRPRC